MSYYTLAISSNHDSSICLLEDSKIVYMTPCERSHREKHTAKISLSDIKRIAEYTSTIDLLVGVNVWDDINNIRSPAFTGRVPQVNGFKRSERMEHLKQLLQEAQINCKRTVIDNSQHHLNHAAAGFYCSGFEDALCLIIDGVGTTWMWDRGVVLSETTSIFHMTNHSVDTLYKHLFFRSAATSGFGWDLFALERIQKTYPYKTDISSHLDIGKMYGTITRHIGFQSSHNAGKLMGLSAYGGPNNLPPLLVGDTIISDANFFKNDSQIDTFMYPELNSLSEKQKQNLAYNVQKALEKVFVTRVKQALDMRPSNNLILGGGCALNILGNSLIKKTFPNLNIYVEPIAADSSQSLGAALYYYKRQFPETKFSKLKNLYLGPEYSTIDIKDKLLKLVEQYNNESNLPV